MTKQAGSYHLGKAIKSYAIFTYLMLMRRLNPNKVKRLLSQILFKHPCGLLCLRLFQLLAIRSNKHSPFLNVQLVLMVRTLLFSTSMDIVKLEEVQLTTSFFTINRLFILGKVCYNSQ